MGEIYIPDDVYNTFKDHGYDDDQMQATIEHYSNQGYAPEKINELFYQKAERLKQPNIGDIGNGVKDTIGGIGQGVADATVWSGVNIGKAINKVTGNAVPKAVSYLTGKGGAIASDDEVSNFYNQYQYKPKTGIGKFAETASKYITGFLTAKGVGISNPFAAGAAADAALYNQKEGHIIGKDQTWDNNLGDIGDRLQNVVEGGVAGVGLEYIAKPIVKGVFGGVKNQLAPIIERLKTAKTPAEVNEVTNELYPKLQEIDNQAIVKDITDQVGNNPQQVFKATQELPYEQAKNVLKEFESQEESKLLDTNPNDGVLEAGAVDNVAKEPYQMTKEEYRQSIAGQEQRQFPDGSKFNGNIADRVLNDTVDQTWEVRGLNKAENENNRQYVQRVIDSYKAKWGNPELPVKLSIRKLGGKAGYVKTLEDGSVELAINSENMYDKAALRHELEHLHDVIKGAVPDNTHFSRYGDEATFAADYSHKKAITKALREGKQIPENVAKDYPNIDFNTTMDSSKNLVKDSDGINIPEGNLNAVNDVNSPIKDTPEQLKLNFEQTPEAKAFTKEVEASGGQVTDNAIQTLAKSDNVAGVVNTISKVAQNNVDPFTRETAEEFVDNSTKFFKEIFDELNPTDDFNEVFRLSDWTREQIRNARLFLGNMRKIQQDVNTNALTIAKKIIEAPEGANKARLMDAFNTIQTKATKVDASIRGSFSEAGRLLQSAQRSDELINKINQYDDFTDTLLKKDLENRGLSTEYFESVVKEATDNIQKLFAQSQGKLIKAEDVEAQLIKALGGDLNTVGVYAQWVKNEALRIFEDYSDADLNKLVRSSARNIINFNKQLELVKGYISSGANPQFWDLVKKQAWNNAPGYFIQNLLSGIPTTIKNLSGGVAKTYFDNISRRLAGTREERELAALEFEALGRNFFRALELGKAAFKNDPLYGRAGQYIETMKDLPSGLQEANQLPVVGSRESWGINQLGADWQPTTAQETFLKVSETLGNISHNLSRWLPMSDEFLTSWNYLAKADSIATQDARKLLQQQTKGNYSVQQVRELADKELNSGRFFNKDTGRPVDVDMLRESREASLVNPISNEEASTTLLYGAGQAVQNFKQKFPVVKFFIPFVNALARLGQNTIDTIPGLAHIPGIGSFQAEMKAGGRRAALVQGKVNLGTTVLGLSFIAGLSGNFTGSYPMDKTERDALSKRGWKPYSVVIKDNNKTRYISYKDIEPFASLVGIGVDLAQNIHHLDEDGVGETIQKTMYSLMRNITDKTFFNSLAQQAELLQPDKWNEKLGSTAGGTLAASVIPGSSFFNHLSNIAAGDTLKEPRTFVQNMLSRVPLANQTLPDKLNDLGEEINVPIAKRLTGWGYNEVENNIVNDELTDLAQYGLKLPAPKEDKNGVHLEEYTDQNGITAYENIHKLKGTIKLGGKTLRQSIDDLIKSDFYKRLPTGEDIQQQGWTQDYSDKYTKIGQISRIYQNYLDAATNETFWQRDFKHENTGVPLKDNYINARRGKYPQLNTTQSLQNAF